MVCKTAEPSLILGGSICRGMGGSLCRGMGGPLYRGISGSVCAETPIYGETGEIIIYIGEAESVLERMSEHIASYSCLF